MERLDTLNFSKELLNNYSYLLKSYEIFFFFFLFQDPWTWYLQSYLSLESFCFSNTQVSET